jgi:hypothetical protein
MALATSMLASVTSGEYITTTTWQFMEDKS